MKQLFISLIMCCLTASGFAQEHLSFKGIPITGSMTDFCQELIKKGFERSYNNRVNEVSFTGAFIGLQARATVVATDDGKDVLGVVVEFYSSHEWDEIANTYAHCKDLYVEKYGEPTQCVEEILIPDDSRTGLDEIDKNPIFALNDGRVTYKCVFEAKGGQIILSIEKSGIAYGNVCISYKDNQNVQAKRQSDLDDI